MRKNFLDAAYEHWKYHDLFSIHWWLLVVLTIGPWVLWWRVVDRRRVYELLVYGLLVGLVSTIIDSIGINLLWWGYNYELYAIVPPLITADISVISVSFMLILQYFPRWKEFIIAQIVLAAVLAFVVELLFQQLGIYVPYTWRHLYSFIIYSAIGIVLRLALMPVSRKQISRFM